MISPLSVHAGVLFSDNFDDGVADGWTVGSGTWAVESFEYSGSGGSQGSGQDVGYATIDTSATTSGMTITADVYTQPGGIGGYIVYDYQGPNNFKIAGSISGYNYWGFGTVTGPASWTWDLLVPETISDATWYRMKLEIAGTNVKLYVDDYRDGSGYVLKAEYNYSSIGSGKIGLSNIWGHAHFDNISITTPDPAPPALTISEPDGVNDVIVAGDAYNIMYTLDDPDDVVTAAFYYDVDNAGYDGVAIAGGCAAAAEGTNVTCSWDTTGMPTGSYYIHGLADDGVNPPVEVYSAGPVTIDLPPPAPPVLSVLQPDGVNDAIFEGSTYSITYTLSDDDDVVTAAFYYDTDNAGYDGTAIPGCAAAAEGTNVTCSWDTTGIPTGSYYIYGVTDDGFHAPVSAYSTGPLTINAPPEYTWIKSITDNLDAPTCIATDGYERIYVAETALNRVNIFSPSGHFIKRLKGLGNPYSIAVDSTGRIFVGNGKSGNVEIYDYDFNLLNKLGTGDGEFMTPSAIAIDSADSVYVADCEADAIKVYNSDGSFNFSFGSPGSGSGQFNCPTAIAIDENAGEIIVPDMRMQSGMMGKFQAPRVQIFDMNGVYKRQFGTRGVGEGLLYRSMGIAVDANSRIYVADSYSNIVQAFDGNGGYLAAIYDLDNPVINPSAVTIGKSKRLLAVSRSTESVEVYGIDNYTDMIVTPLSVIFQAVEGGSNPALQSVDIINSGQEPITWNASSAHSWITLSSVSGALNPGESSTVNVGVDISGFAAGGYEGTINISSDSGALETVAVTLTVALPPELTVSPSSLVFESINGAVPPSQALSIDNTTGGQLDWAASPDRSWIVLDKSSGTAPDAVSVSVDPSSLAEGTHTGNVAVIDTGQPGSSVTVPVTLHAVSLTGTINVTTNHAGATFIISGPAPYSGSGTGWSASGAPTGAYTIVYGSIPGHITPPSQSLTLQDGGTINFNGLYVEETGTINVTTNNAQATFTLSGPASYSGSGTSWSIPDAPAGTYDITFGDVAGYNTPQTQTKSLLHQGTVTFDGQYEVRYKNIIAGAGYGDSNTGLVKVFTSAGLDTGVSFNAHSYMYGVNVASGDVDGDGIDEIITAPGPGPGNPSEIRIFNSQGSHMSNLDVTAFQQNYGANVASADFDGDGYHEVIAGTGGDRENLSYVKIYVYDPAVQQLVDSGIDLFPYTSDYGAHVAAGDIDGNGIAELITSPGPGNQNLGIVRIWSIDTSAGTGQWSASLINEFTVQSEYKYSVTIACGDVNGDGNDEIITGDGPHSKARDVVRVYDRNGVLLNVWQAGTHFNGYGANVASGDLKNDSTAEIIVAPGPDPSSISLIKVFNNVGAEKAAFDPFNLPYGANVAVGDLGLEAAQ